MRHKFFLIQCIDHCHAARHASGLPPNVVPWLPACRISAASPLPRQAPMGTPFPSDLAILTTSGNSSLCWKANHLPVRPMPVCTSSKINSASFSSAKRRKLCRNSPRKWCSPPSHWIGSMRIAAIPCGCGSEQADPPRGAVLIFLDTVRPDRLSCYGHDVQTSPNISALAERGVLFEEAVSHAPWTLPSAATMLGSGPLRYVYDKRLKRSAVKSLQTAGFTPGQWFGPVQGQPPFSAPERQWPCPAPRSRLSRIS